MVPTILAFPQKGCVLCRFFFVACFICTYYVCKEISIITLCSLLGSNAGGRKCSRVHADSPSFLCPRLLISVLFDPPLRRRQLLPRCLGRSFGRSFWKQGSALLTAFLSSDHGYNLLASSPLNTLKAKPKTFKLRFPQTCTS